MKKEIRANWEIVLLFIMFFVLIMPVVIRDYTEARATLQAYEERSQYSEYAKYNR